MSIKWYDQLIIHNTRYMCIMNLWCYNYLLDMRKYLQLAAMNQVIGSVL